MTRSIRELCLLLVYGVYAVCSAPERMRENFNAQVEQILREVMLTPEEVHEISLSFTDLQDMLRSRWEGADLFVYGSLLNGLGTKTSDVDIYVRLPNYNVSADKYIVQETAKLLHTKPEKYSNVEAKLKLKVPMMTYYDVTIKRYIDLSFRSFYGITSAKIIAYYLNLDQRYIPLAAIIKLWCKVHQLTGKQLAPNYALYMMVIFYLQQKKLSPSGYEIQRHLPGRFIDHWNINFEEISYRTNQDDSLYDLLGGFFKYYSEFDFKNNCVSPFVGRPVAKTDFLDMRTIPEEYSLMREKFATGENKTNALQTSMCIQDIFEHNKNTASRIKTKYLIKFINHLQYAAKIYDNAYSDQFLRQILSKDEYNEIEHKFKAHFEL